MKAEILSITVAAPTDVGEKGHEFFVHLRIGEIEKTVDTTAVALLDHWQFQKEVLSQTGQLADFGILDASDEFDAIRRWQRLLGTASWQFPEEPDYDEARIKGIDDDESESFYRVSEGD